MKNYKKGTKLKFDKTGLELNGGYNANSTCEFIFIKSRIGRIYNVDFMDKYGNVIHSDTEEDIKDLEFVTTPIQYFPWG
ncbi:MAG TPA: hypothetical protein VI911_08615 [Patescibacteria group bacterium]|nr:MAG: hypothetical protein UR43_C0005G0110 [candidate division TM6 bacterium GW2011_GWF2_33_332]HLD91058.1 hypothetical protein [Patescibacteria group bacterium]